MTPIKFPQSNIVLKGPAGGDIMDLPAATDGRHCVSCWQASWRERVAFLLTGKIWLHVMSGWTQPPVCVSIDEPATAWERLKAFAAASRSDWDAIVKSVGRSLKRDAQRVRRQ